jgi:hypothetical protein
MAGTPAIGERIVTVTYLNQTTGFSVTYIKATQATPAVPVCSMTDEGITVTSPLGTEYEYSKDGGTNWQTDVTFRYLIHGNQYTIVTRLIETDTYLASNASEGTTIKFRNLNKQKSGETEVDIIINDNIETAATSKTTIKNNKTVTTITINDNKIVEKLNNESDNAIVSIQVDNTTDVVKGQLNGETVKNMEMKSAILEIKTKNITYTLPASQVNIDNVSLQIGTQVELKDIMVDVKIAEPPADTVKFVEDIANKNNYQVVVKPVEFEINCTSRNKTVQVSKFNGYVERTVAIPDGIDPSKITTGIVLNSDGTFSHVPTTIIQVNDKYFAKINSLTNSIYSVIYCPKTFKDVENHWAKKDVNDMGSRLIINGVDDNRFEPERDITRAEFATIAVKALGLMRPSSGKETFLDVEKTAWYYDAVSIACEYKLISGYADGTFKPNKKITREEAMKIILNALEIVQDDTTLPESDIQEQLANFIDSNEVSSWAQKAVATCIKSGIVQGNNNKVFVKENITRAQTATIIRRMLQKTELI